MINAQLESSKAHCGPYAHKVRYQSPQILHYFKVPVFEWHESLLNEKDLFRIPNERNTKTSAVQNLKYELFTMVTRDNLSAILDW